ncbi:MAG: hypothetical protein E6I97_22545 [Chloroflexi bacterium]|nr:MAG: hypothetical protein E6I97_22545 [Chloroflexota bacterium]
MRGQEAGYQVLAPAPRWGPLAAPAVGCPPHNGKPAARPAGALLESPQERLPLGLPEANHGQASLSLIADLKR